ncbi:MAG: SUMF1/EgtB/PvdO family nonheme iron enzyme [Sphingobacterium sp.]|nr:SUMF1/EgtB/PvdO family nonheme iron enzyme [Sphingobacterium sp.]
METMLRTLDADGVVLDTRGESSREFQDAADRVKPGIIMYSEGMAVPRDMPGIVSGPRPRRPLHAAAPQHEQVHAARLRHLPGAAAGRGTAAPRGGRGLLQRLRLGDQHHAAGPARLDRGGSPLPRPDDQAPARELVGLPRPGLGAARPGARGRALGQPLARRREDRLHGLQPEARGIQGPVRRGRGPRGRAPRQPLEPRGARARRPGQAGPTPRSTSRLSTPPRSGRGAEGNVDCVAVLPSLLKVEADGELVTFEAPGAPAGSRIVVSAGNPSYAEDGGLVRDGEAHRRPSRAPRLPRGEVRRPALRRARRDPRRADRPAAAGPPAPGDAGRADGAGGRKRPPGMVEVPAGTFVFKTAGNPDDANPIIPYPDTQKPRTLAMRRFFMDRTPVTNAAFAEFLDGVGLRPRRQVELPPALGRRQAAGRAGGSPRRLGLARRRPGLRELGRQAPADRGRVAVRRARPGRTALSLGQEDGARPLQQQAQPDDARRGVPERREPVRRPGHGRQRLAVHGRRLRQRRLPLRHHPRRELLRAREERVVRQERAARRGPRPDPSARRSRPRPGRDGRLPLRQGRRLSPRPAVRASARSRVRRAPRP